MTVPLYMGVDIGAAASKAVIIDRDRAVLGKTTVPSGIDFQAAADAVIKATHHAAGTGPSQIIRTVACGYGRRNVLGSDFIKTEIACHAKGAHHFVEEATTVLDVGGQDNKIIRVSKTGSVIDFKMNHKCAAGTGAFLEEIAHRMGVPIENMASLADRADAPAPLSAFCTVFAGAEILAAARKGTPKESLALGVFAAMVERAISISGLKGDVTVTGGVAAHNPVFCRLLGDKLEGTLCIPPLSQYIGAIGAAIFALESSNHETGEE